MRVSILRMADHAPMLVVMHHDDEQTFRVRTGRPPARDRQSALPFTRRVLRIAARQAGGLQHWRGSGSSRRTGEGTGAAGLPRTSGRFNARGRGRQAAAALPRTNSWSAPEKGMRFRSRRVVVKARVVPVRGAPSRGGEAHLRYLERDGVTRDGAEARVYSAIEDQADGKAFLARGREDRHQFRFIVSPEDAADMGDLRDFTRRLIGQMEQDLETRLDWVAVDHHNTGHAHTHVVLRGVTEDGKTLNIAGDYIAHGIRARACELVTLELGPESEWEVQQKLRLEVDQERLTRLDRALLQEANAQHLVDLAALESYVGRTNRTALYDRLKKLERLGLATPGESGQWTLAPELERSLQRLGERSEIARSIERVLVSQGIERRDLAIHRNEVEAPVVGRLLGQGLGQDELADKVGLVVDGADGRIHYMEVSTAPSDLHRGSIVEIGPAAGRPADRNIAGIAQAHGGIYRPIEHLLTAMETVRLPDENYGGYVQAHVRRLEALRRAGIVERIDADQWRIPADFEQRAAAYDLRHHPRIAVRVLSAFDLDRQVASDGATWLDRQLVGRQRIEPVPRGFGREVGDALARRQQTLVDRGYARRADDGSVHYCPGLLTTLERTELQRTGAQLAQRHGVPFHAAEDGEWVHGRFRETVQLASGKYALLENGHELTLVPWRPVIERELGRELSARVHGMSISWELGRSRTRGLGR